VIVRVDAGDEVLGRVTEELEADARIEAEQAKGSRAFVAGGNVDREAFQGDAAIARSQVGKPDQPEREHGGGVAFGRACDGGPAVLAVAKKGARERGRETVFEIGFSADLRRLPFRKLPPQKEAEPLAKYHASAAFPQLRAGAACKVEQKQLPFALRKALDHEFEACAAGIFYRGDAASEVAVTVPGLEGQARAAHFHAEIFGREGEQLFAGLEQRRLPGILEESLDGGAGLIGAAAGVPRGEWHRKADCSTGWSLRPRLHAPAETVEPAAVALRRFAFGERFEERHSLPLLGLFLP